MQASSLARSNVHGIHEHNYCFRQRSIHIPYDKKLKIENSGHEEIIASKNV